ncbi:MAG: hypothetical protein JWP89_3437 [Schlesneria sp.]|nr:hypothetical protein [Schlesneria sp.]
MNVPVLVENLNLPSDVLSDTTTIPPNSHSSEASPSASPLLQYRRIAIAVGDDASHFVAKTAIGLLRYREHDVVAVVAADQSGRHAQDVYGVGGSIPVVASLEQAGQPDSVFIGIAPLGGRLTTSLQNIIRNAVAKGIDVVSGLHEFLFDDPALRQQALQSGSRLIDVRKNDLKLVAKAARFRPECLRIHTVGHDCSVGKMTVALEVENALKKRRIDAKFLATGQTGIMIAGDGIPVDCVVSDFVNGAVEDLVWRHQHHDILLIEGQGGLTHPAYSGVTLGLLHGCAPHAMIMCVEAGRTHVKGLDNIEIPSLERLCALFEMMASQRFPSVVIGVAINSKHVSAGAARNEAASIRSRLGLPVCDVFLDGPEELVEAILAFQSNR